VFEEVENMAPGADTFSRTQQLKLEIAVVETRIQQIDAQCHQRFSYGNDAGDEANDLLERTKSAALRECLEDKLKQLNDALAHITEGKDGVCAICGNAIDPARLQVIPEAILCVTCQRHREQSVCGAKMHKSFRHF
jgi:DnaK suppressor protein